MLWRTESTHVWVRIEILFESCRGHALRKVIIPSPLKLTEQFAPENRPSEPQKEISSSKHPFLGASC